MSSPQPSTRARVVVTGANGFIGHAVVRALRSTGVDVVGVGRTRPTDWPAEQWRAADLRDPATHAAAVANADLLIHLAWNVEHGRFWTAHDNVDWVAATVRLARAFVAQGGTRFVGLGTCVEYDVATSTDALNEASSLISPTTLYGIAKDATRRTLAGYAAEVGLSFGWARMFHLYGPREDPRRLVASIIRNLGHDQPAACSSGRQLRDFMHVDEAGRAIATLALSQVEGAVNVASGQPVTIAEVAEAIGRLMQRPHLIKLGALPDRAGDPPSILADVTRLRREVGFASTLTVSQGLRETIDWWARH